MNHGMIRFIATLFLACLSLMAQGVEKVIHYHNDALGSPIAATDQDGRVVWRKYYTPYGQLIDQTAPNEPGYTGKFEEPDLGIQNFGARWYDPRIGRFLAIDPAGFDPQNPQSFNRYAYANNNPYRYVDPDGRAPKVPYQLNFDLGIGGGSYGMGYGRTSRAQAPPRTTGEGVVEAGGGNRGTAPSSEVAKGGPVIGRMDDLTAPGAIKAWRVHVVGSFAKSRQSKSQLLPKHVGFARRNA